MTDKVHINAYTFTKYDVLNKEVNYILLPECKYIHIYCAPGEILYGSFLQYGISLFSPL